MTNERYDDDDDDQPPNINADDTNVSTEQEAVPLLSSPQKQRANTNTNTHGNNILHCVKTNITSFLFNLQQPTISHNNLYEALSHYWSNLTFNWISPLLTLGNTKGQLSVEDLDTSPLPSDCETGRVYEVFVRCWEEELKRVNKREKQGKKSCGGSDKRKKGMDGGIAEENNDDDAMEAEMDLLDLDLQNNINNNTNYQQPSLIRALYQAFGTDFLYAGLYKLIHDSNLFIGPQVLNHLIRFLRDENAPLSRGVWLVLIVTVSQIVMSISLRHYFYKCYTCGLRVRTAIVIAIYRKSLVLSLKERHAHGGPGEIANLVGIDAQRIQDLMTYLHAVWYSFFQIGLALYFLWGQVGRACLAGVVVILLLIPTTKFIAAWLGRIQKKLMKARDERVALNNEILGAMKIIKIQAWEENFRDKLLKLRNYELYRLRKYFFTSAISVSMYSSTPLLVSLATFAAYTMGGHTLDVAEALTALALFDILRFPLFMLPQIINRIVEAGISFERVREFLLCEEYKSVGEGALKEDGEVWMKNGTFVYDSKKPLLQDENESTGGGIGKLMQKHRRKMQEAVLDRQWEMILMKAQLIDAEDRIQTLQKQVQPELACDDSVGGEGVSAREQGGKWSPSSLLSLRRVCMHCKPGEFVAVVGGVGAGKVSPILLYEHGSL